MSASSVKVSLLRRCKSEEVERDIICWHTPTSPVILEVSVIYTALQRATQVPNIFFHYFYHQNVKEILEICTFVSLLV